MKTSSFGKAIEQEDRQKLYEHFEKHIKKYLKLHQKHNRNIVFITDTKYKSQKNAAKARFFVEKFFNNVTATDNCRFISLGNHEKDYNFELKRELKANSDEVKKENKDKSIDRTK